MYIQSPVPEGQGHITLPKGYSGNAFATAQTPPSTESKAPTVTQESVPLPQDAPLEKARSAPQDPPPPHPPETDAEKDPHTAEAFAAATGKQGGHTLFARFPFLSSLLPPARHKNGGLPEWAIIGLVLFLLLSERENDNDLLPFLLLLLLWD